LNSTRTTDPYCTDVVCDPNCRPFSTRPRRPQTPRYQRPQYQRPQYQRSSPCVVPRNTCDTDTTTALDQVIRLAQQKVDEAKRATKAARQANIQSKEREIKQLECSIAESTRKKDLLAQQTQKVKEQAQKVGKQLEEAKDLQTRTGSTQYGRDAASYVANAIAACEAAVRQNNELNAKLEDMTKRNEAQLKEHEQRKEKITEELDELNKQLTGGDLDEFESQDEDSSVQGGRIVNKSLEVDLDA
jgi:DNA repair exonuclease SbcCD ATPase subunit